MKGIKRILISVLVAACIVGFAQPALGRSNPGNNSHISGMIGDPEHKVLRPNGMIGDPEH